MTWYAKVAIVHATPLGSEYVPDHVSFEWLWRHNCIVNSSVLVRRAVWESVGGCDEDREIISVEDYNLWLRIAAAGWDIVTCREDLIIYICEAGHLTSRYEKYARAELANVDRIASQLNLDARRIEEKRTRTYDEQGRLLLYNRRIEPARALPSRRCAGARRRRGSPGGSQPACRNPCSTPAARPENVPSPSRRPANRAPTRHRPARAKSVCKHLEFTP